MTARLRAWLRPAEPARRAPAWRRHGTTVGVQVLAFVGSMAILLGLLALIGYRASGVLDALWNGSVGSKVALGLTLNEATPLILTATAVWVAAQSGMFNIGADGQLQLGGVAALVVASDAGLPHVGPLLIVASLLAAAATGAAWAAIAALLKAYRGASEVISTLMLNFIAFIVIDQLVQGPIRSKTNAFTPQTDPVPVAAQIKPLFAGTQITWTVILAAAVAVATVTLVAGTRIGLRLRAVGLNQDAARHAGLRRQRYWVGSLTGSGAICGLAGGLVLLGLRLDIAPGWAEEWGFQGILVAFLTFRAPYLIPLWGVLFGMIAAAGPELKAEVSVPDSIVTVIQTLPVILLFALYSVGRWWTRRGLGKPGPAPPEAVATPSGDVGALEGVATATGPEVRDA